MMTRPLVILLATTYFASAARADLFVVSGNSAEIIRYDLATGTSTVFAHDPGGYLESLAYGPDGNFYVSNLIAQSVDRFSGTTGASLGSFVAPGSGGVLYPHDIAFGPGGDLYVDSGEAGPALTGAILKYDGATGAFLGDLVPPDPSVLYHPTAMAFSDGILYVASNTQPSAILRYDATTGAFLGTFASSPNFSNISGLFFDARGDLFVANSNADDVLEYDPSGALLRTLTAPGLVAPAYGAFGPDGNLYVTGYGSDNIVVFDPTTGDYLRTFAQGGRLDQPFHLVFVDAVPEPSSIALIGLGSLAVLASRRKVRRGPMR